MINKNKLLECDEFVDALMDAVFIDKLYINTSVMIKQNAPVREFLIQILKDKKFLDKDVKYVNIKVWRKNADNIEDGFSLVVDDRKNRVTSSARFEITTEFMDGWRMRND